MSKTEKIRISRSHHMGKDQNDLNWVIAVPFNAEAMFKHEIDGVSLMSTTRNYYYGKTSDQKIHYNHMGTEGSSAAFYRDVYAEVIPGIYRYISICTDSNFDEVLKGCADAVNTLSSEFKKEFKEALVIFNEHGAIPSTTENAESFFSAK
jgi:hypothetical protein